MIDEGYIEIESKRFGAAAFARRKQWWSFEGLDTGCGVYFVFLAMQSFPTGYVALTAIDIGSGRRIAEEHLCGVKALPGEKVDVSASGKWGRVRFSGRAEEKWIVEVETDAIKARLEQVTRSGMHRNRLLTKRIDYSILQSVRNDVEGSLSFGGKDFTLSGWGYCEHAWGVQPRHSAANWMHFWSPASSGVVMDCRYDEGVPHNYTLIWDGGQNHYLFSPVQFFFDTRRPEAPWEIASPDLELKVTPIHVHRTVKKIPPLLPWFDIDYYEMLAEVSGAAVVRGASIPIKGIAKYDHNFNKW